MVNFLYFDILHLIPTTVQCGKIGGSFQAAQCARCFLIKGLNVEVRRISAEGHTLHRPLMWPFIQKAQWPTVYFVPIFVRFRIK
jgi:hypothetical protein